jgi:hypothetical protein
MTELPGTTVRRAGLTSRYWYETILTVNVEAAAELRIIFSMRSKGGGRTQLQMEIRPTDFPTLLQTMCKVDRQVAMNAMASELGRQTTSQAQHDREAILHATKKCAEDISQFAHKKYRAKPSGEDQEEQIIMDGVDAIISELKLS